MLGYPQQQFHSISYKNFQCVSASAASIPSFVSTVIIISYLQLCLLSLKQCQIICNIFYSFRVTLLLKMNLETIKPIFSFFKCVFLLPSRLDQCKPSMVKNRHRPSYVGQLVSLYFLEIWYVSNILNTICFRKIFARLIFEVFHKIALYFQKTTVLCY